jgi:hypothetical protein
MAPQTSARRIVILSLTLFWLGAAWRPVAVAAAPLPELTRLPTLAAFAQSVADGKPEDAVGAYAHGLFALAVVQQPGGLANFVSKQDEALTQFDWPRLYGVVGLLAHNYLSGALFSQLAQGQRVSIIYGDGEIETFVVTQAYRYRATDPFSVRSDFVDLQTLDGLSAEGLFRKVYQGSRHVTFQTCIAKEGNSSWGRLFVLAEPVLDLAGRGR